MSEAFGKINSLPILDVLSKAGFRYSKDPGSTHMYTLHKPDGSKDNSFKIHESKNIAVDFGGTGIKGGTFDVIGRLLLNVDTQTNTGKVETLKWFTEQGYIEDSKIKKVFQVSLKKEQLLEKYESLRLGGYSQEFGVWLKTRGVQHDFIIEKSLDIGEFCKDIGYYDNFYCCEDEIRTDEDGKILNKSENVKVLLFPCYDIDSEDKKVVVGLKLRRVDGKNIYGKKSYAVGKTGLLWNKIDSAKPVYICEGEADWVIMQILGYKNSIGNLGGVQSHRDKLKRLLYESSNIICLYDSDDAGELGKINLQEAIGKQIYKIDMPIRTSPTGKKLSDVNDLYKVGYDTKKRWDAIFQEVYQVGQVKGDSSNGKRYIFLDKHLEFYDTFYKKIQNSSDVAVSQGLTNKELHSLVRTGEIQKYIDLCYYYGGKEGYYNTLNPDTILMTTGDEKPVLHPHIKYLIENVCGGSRQNVDWIHGAILYKLTHLNDPTLPAVVFYGDGGSGKGTFVDFLSRIFGKENTQFGITQKLIDSSFDAYTGEKLVVEIIEVISGNTMDDKKMTNKLKSIIGEKTIMVRRLYQQPKEVENIAWFIISSNHSIPIQLDDKQTGNRRFSIIRTGKKMNSEKAFDMRTNTFNDKKVIQQYIAWLYEHYPEVTKMNHYAALDNKEKRMLEENCSGVGNKLFERFEDKFPHVWKISAVQMRTLKSMYMTENGISHYDRRYEDKNFDLSVGPGRYEVKKVRVGGRVVRGYYINKDEQEILDMKAELGPAYKDLTGEFTKSQWNSVLREQSQEGFNNM